MKRSHLKKTGWIRNAIRGRLAVSFKRALGMSAFESTPDLKVAKKEISDTLLTHDNLRRINEQILKADMLRSYAIQLVHDKQRCR